MNLQAESVEDLRSIVKQAERLKIRCGGTKTALSAPFIGAETVEMNRFSGVLEYRPEEYTFTALAGTRLLEMSRMLAEHGQYMPFDPPFIRKGATLGGTVAAGLSGSGRYHFGGVRDFLLGVQFVDGRGELVRGGGKVVKNAAGFDLPKLMVGSLGEYGILYELTFKVFPLPAAAMTIRFDTANLEQALQWMLAASTSQVDLDALDLEPGQAGCRLWVRISGPLRSLSERADQLQRILGVGVPFQDEQESAIWEKVSEFDWVPEDWSLLKIPITPGKIHLLDPPLAEIGCLRRYSSGGQVAWVATAASPLDLASMLEDISLEALVLTGPIGKTRLGAAKSEAFHRLVRSVFDPDNRFVEG